MHGTTVGDPLLRASEPDNDAGLIRRSLRWLTDSVRTLADGLPPYVVIKGEVEEKGTDADGKPYVRVASHTVEVDAHCLRGLMVGDLVEVRKTKGHRAVNIYMIIPEDEDDLEESE